LGDFYDEPEEGATAPIPAVAHSGKMDPLTITFEVIGHRQARLAWRATVRNESIQPLSKVLKKVASLCSSHWRIDSGLGVSLEGIGRVDRVSPPIACYSGPATADEASGLGYLEDGPGCRRNSMCPRSPKPRQSFSREHQRTDPARYEAFPVGADPRSPSDMVRFQ
jgi:hypothetical protein